MKLSELTLRELYDLADKTYNELFALQGKEQPTNKDLFDIKQKQYECLVIEEHIQRKELIKRFGNR